MKIISIQLHCIPFKILQYHIAWISSIPITLPAVVKSTLNKTCKSLAPNTAVPPTIINSMVAPNMMKTKVGFLSYKKKRILIRNGRCTNCHFKISYKETRNQHISSHIAFGLSFSLVPKSGLVVTSSSFPELCASDTFCFWSSLKPVNIWYCSVSFLFQWLSEMI